MIDVNVLAHSAAPYSINDARTALKQQAISRGLVAMRAPRHERANAAVLGSRQRAAPRCHAESGPIPRLASGAGARASRGRCRRALLPDSQSWIVESEAFQSMRRTIRVPLLLPGGALW